MAATAHSAHGSSVDHLKLEQLDILEDKFLKAYEARLAPNDDSVALQSYQEQLEAFLGPLKKLPVLEHPPSPRQMELAEDDDDDILPLPVASSPRKEVWLSASGTDTDMVVEG
eukprot:5719292-Pleurochrysis_carterae.AAC.1